MSRKSLAVLFLLMLMTSPAAAENLLNNAGFEKGLTEWQWVKGDPADATCELVSDVVHSGNSAILITNKSKYDIYKRLLQPVSLKPNTKYKLTAWSKGKDMGWWGVRVGAARDGDWNRLTFLPSGHSGDRNYEWKQTVYEFTTDDNTGGWALQIQVNDTIGQLWLDDISLEEVIAGILTASGADLFTPTILDDLDDAGFYPALHTSLACDVPVLNVKPKGKGNSAFGFKITWSDKGLHFLIEVTDDMPGSTVKGDNMWQGDSVQIALDTSPDVRRKKLDEHFYELGYAVTAPGDVEHWSWRKAGKSGQNKLDWTDAKETGKVNGKGWFIKAFLPWQAIGLSADKLPEEIAFNIMVNNADKGGSRTNTEWTSGMSTSKSPCLYNNIILVKPDQRAPAGFVSFDRQDLYSAEQTINGAYEDYAHINIPAGTLCLEGVRIIDGKTVPLGRMSLPRVRAGQVRRVPFSMPVSVIAEEGDWRIVAHLADSTANSRIMVRQDLGLKVLEMLAAEKTHLEKVKTAASKANVLKDSYVNAAVYIAERFFDRIENNPDMLVDVSIKPDSLNWQKQQLEEVKIVLDKTEALIAKLASGKPLPGEIGRPTGGPIKINGSQFYTEVELPDGSKEVRPFFFGGYLSCASDLKPDYWAIGATLLQVSVGGHWAANKDLEAVAGFDRAETAHKKRMYVDFLNQLHGMPEWLSEENPDFLIKGLPSGFIKFYLSHPIAKKYTETFTSTLAAACKDRPGVFGICIENEPAYYVGGHDKYSRPLYTAFLTQRHGTIDKLNDLYGTEYKDFASVDPPLPLGCTQPKIAFVPEEAQQGGGSTDDGSYRPDSVGQSRWYFDWCEFNTDYLMDWLEGLNGLAKKAAPCVSTHIKVMATVGDQSTLWGAYNDVERPTMLTDIAGNDLESYYFKKQNFDHYPAGYAFKWMKQGMAYDYQWSISGKPVYNSENHIIEDNTTTPVPLEDTRAALWHQGLHHQGATAIWVWDLHYPTNLPLQGSIYVRPANMYAAAIAFFDLNRLMDRVALVANAKPRVAILHSSVPMFWEQDGSYDKTVTDAYITLTLSGEAVGFVTPRMLAAGDYRDYKVIIVPNTVAVRQSTVDGLTECVKRGIKVIAIGKDNLTRDEYWQQRKLPAGLADMTVLKRQEDARLLAHELRKELENAGLELIQLVDAQTGRPAWGVECRVVPSGDGKLVSMINLMPDTQTVKLDLPGKAMDLVTGDTKDIKALTLQPMEYVLLEVYE